MDLHHISTNVWQLGHCFFVTYSILIFIFCILWEPILNQPFLQKPWLLFVGEWYQKSRCQCWDTWWFWSLYFQALSAERAWKYTLYTNTTYFHISIYTSIRKHLYLYYAHHSWCFQIIEFITPGHILTSCSGLSINFHSISENFSSHNMALIYTIFSPVLHAWLECQYC